MEKEIYPSYTPAELSNYYNFPKNYTGKGQKIAIISLGGKPNMNEIKSDFKDLGVEIFKLDFIDVNPDSISIRQDFMPTLETHLDVEIIGAICPDSSITIYRGANASGFADAINNAIADGNHVISISWGYSEYEGVKTCEVEKVLQLAKEKNITVCVAAGDGGSADARTPSGGAGIAADGKAHVNYPASSPLVLACGGTELIEENNKTYEKVWNNALTGGGATGGGVSEYFDLPKWQSAFKNITSVNSNNTGRIVPDVSALAASGDIAIYQNDTKIEAGGTSAIAPLWAAFIALANEAREQINKKPLGFINDSLYYIASKTNVFNPITEGNNAPQANYPGYEANSKFNACCGLGTPKGNELFEELLKLD